MGDLFRLVVVGYSSEAYMYRKVYLSHGYNGCVFCCGLFRLRLFLLIRAFDNEI
ncbi:hypothetical protein LLO_0842 [Legionella longbeachae NSW150]|uniref:Uncharacterized protein n=1 Tax=Legionella longbeachae serogroup 1 (strain NSW150) TaxID=661367 RepID=D3HQL7_LEGLN|nr:hypothetical protein LLO_0842 [Legionella longbeachae NSW150]